MLERSLKAADRRRIREYTREQWDRRMRLRGDMDEPTAELVRQDVRRYLRRKPVGSGILGAILMQIALRFAMKLIEKWLRDFNERR
jgi:hypothetical protein